ncbi:MAG: GNAT family N-acetyltransferase [Defluviitaleaceae bacterium]|nr:GNAT family N-acetyltransferase [Defluviitaleaceae bacterium]
MKEKALKYLEKNSLFHMSMIFPIKRGTADIFYAKDDGVFFRETESNAYMLSITDFNKGRELFDKAGRQNLVCVFQKDIAVYLHKKHNYRKCMENFQAVYTKKVPIKIEQRRLDIQPLNLSHLDLVYEHYHDDVDYDYLKRRLSTSAIYGSFINDELCGFAGTHEEGSIGILKVLEKFRRQGFALELESYMVNIFLERGDIPFAQVNPPNTASIALHKKIGFELSADCLYWLFD